MTYYRRVGDVPRKRHTLHRVDGAVAAEELVGEEGFSGPSSLLYHRHSPSAISAIEPVESTPSPLTPNQPVTPFHIRSGDVPISDDTDAVTGRVTLLGNDDVTIGYGRASIDSPLYRNAVGDELLYVQSGSAVLESVFGRLPVAGGDYVLVPTGVTHRWVVERDPLKLLVIESRHHVGIPGRYLTPTGQLAEGAPFSERDLRGPDPEPLLVEGDDVAVLVRTRGGWSRHVHRHHPFDVVGWDGCVYPWALSIHDFEPIVGRIHQPPPVHQTFAGEGFVVCSFVPRPYDFDDHSVKVPYHHSNVDSDEVLFYSAGDFMSRAGSGIGIGSLSVHPAGFIHGPQPGSRERSETADGAEEVAVMIDTFRPLALSDAARTASDPAYPWSWNGSSDRPAP